LQAVYDSLLKIGPDGAELLPSLATKWSYNADNTVLTMTLRSDVKFTDGTPLTADVAAQNLLRYKSGTGSQAALISSISDVKATDATTLVITLSQPDPALLPVLAQAPGLVENPKGFDAPDAKTNPAGSGPYTLDTGKTVVGSSYVFTKNPNYWDPSSVHYDSVTVKVFTDSTAMLNAMRGKQINAATVSDSKIFDQVKAAGYSTIDVQTGVSGILLLDRAGKINPALANVKVRQAINHAIDRDAMLKALARGYGSVTGQMFNPAGEAYDKNLDSTYNYDPGKAKQLMAEAGYASGFTLTLPTSAGQGSEVWPLVQQQLGEIGITTKFEDVGQNLITELLAGKYAAGYISLGKDPIDWLNVKNLAMPNATWNPLKYTDPSVDSLVSTIQNSTGDAQSKALKELNKYLVDQAWFNPWYSRQYSFATDTNTTATWNPAGQSGPFLRDIKPKA
jgi:peptide/nickel transport system substrate-binding protein